ncbi:transposase [Crassaminicella profunda]|uniref:transposase n=1 Tax=Crassaminicella profunda TaxID=1286698 RepID=UPI001CA6F58B|nr:transposase [Crassaminicella profunda]QZY53717.1 transposase [Crassaminicella profunda]
MPRLAREKSERSIFHIMIRSISEIDLFKKDEDKQKYFELIKKYKQKYQFKLYAYCLMTNHGHLMIDVNGADISRIMHSINFCYAQYYNRKYKRHGHVFQDRFKSKMVNDENYLITLSAYIHNNTKDLPMYKDHIEEYEFSSLKEYMHQSNTFGILDGLFLIDLMNLKSRKNRDDYLNLVKKCDNEKNELDIEFENVEYEYRSERRIISRDYKPSKVIEFVAAYLKEEKEGVRIKYSRKYSKLRAISCFFMSCFCNINQKNICHILGNITQTNVSRLCRVGMEMVFKDKMILERFLA